MQQRRRHGLERIAQTPAGDLIRQGVRHEIRDLCSLGYFGSGKRDAEKPGFGVQHEQQQRADNDLRAAEAERDLYRAQQLRTAGRIVSGLNRAAGRRDQAADLANRYLTEPGGLSQREALAGFERQKDRMERMQGQVDEFETSIRTLYRTMERTGDFAGVSALNDELSQLGLGFAQIARIRTDGGRESATPLERTRAGVSTARRYLGAAFRQPPSC